MAERAAGGAAHATCLIAGRADHSRCLYTGLREFDERYGAFDVMEEDWLIGLGAVTSGGRAPWPGGGPMPFWRRNKTGIRVPAGDELGQVARPERGRRGAHQCPQARPVARGPGGKISRGPGPPRGVARRSVYGSMTIRSRPRRCVRAWREHVRQHGRPDFVVIDHLHELSSTLPFKGLSVAGGGVSPSCSSARPSG